MAYKWVLHWEEHFQVFPSFTEAKDDLLEELWFHSREFIDADPPFAEEIMQGWSEVVTWQPMDAYLSDFKFAAEIAGMKYQLSRDDRYYQARGSVEDASL